MPDGNQKAYTALYDVLESAEAREESLEAAEHTQDEELLAQRVAE